LLPPKSIRNPLQGTKCLGVAQADPPRRRRPGGSIHERKIDWHAKGEQDATERNRDPPHSCIRQQVFDGLLDSSEQTEQKIEDIQTYHAGYANEKSQR